MTSKVHRRTRYFSLNSLKGRQSVRATFSLSANAIHLLSTLASQLGIKQKSIFDHLVEDPKVLYQVADEARKKKPETGKRRQKTFVLSRNSLASLDTVAREYQLSRDILVEFSINCLQPVIDTEKKRHENRKSLLAEMENFGRQGEKMMRKALTLVGENDSVYQQLEQVLTQYGKNVDELRQMIEKGKCMEDF